jgi:two-component system sensor histidine kinase ChiS
MDSRKKRILVVEDDTKLSKTLQEWLQLHAFEVRGEVTGQGALSCAMDYQPDVVILDLKLPDMSGLDVCRQLRQQFNPWELPIMMLTALDSPADQLRGFAHGADAYLAKPVDLTDVLKTICLITGEAATL